MCPWDQFAQAAPAFCEKALCGWIKEPANTWSNIGYLLVAMWLWRRSHRDGFPGLELLAFAAGATGVGSALFHATYLAWAGAADYLGMFLGTGALTALNARRLYGISWARARLVFFLVTALFLSSVLLFPDWSHWIYALGGPCCLLEALLYRRDGMRTDYRDYLLAWAMVAFAAGFWWLDVSRLVCAPDNHVLGGHALWHLLTAGAFYFIYRFYTQFAELRD